MPLTFQPPALTTTVLPTISHTLSLSVPRRRCVEPIAAEIQFARILGKARVSLTTTAQGEEESANDVPAMEGPEGDNGRGPLLAAADGADDVVTPEVVA